MSIVKPNGSFRNDQDRLFWRFILLLFSIVVLFGLSMAIVLITGDQALGLRMLNVFAVMFSSIVSLGTGYLLGVHVVERAPSDG